MDRPNTTANSFIRHSPLQSTQYGAPCGVRKHSADKGCYQGIQNTHSNRPPAQAHMHPQQSREKLLVFMYHPEPTLPHALR